MKYCRRKRRNNAKAKRYRERLKILSSGKDITIAIINALLLQKLVLGLHKPGSVNSQEQMEEGLRVHCLSLFVIDKFRVRGNHCIQWQIH